MQKACCTTYKILLKIVAISLLVLKKVVLLQSERNKHGFHVCPNNPLETFVI